MRDRIAISIVLCLMTSVTWGQQQPSGGSAQSGASQSMPGMDMPAHDMSNMKDMPMGADKDKDGDNSKDGEASMHAMHSMEGHMDMGPHMKMTALRPARPGDAERAQMVVDAARKASSKYLDYHVALADGFRIFHPEIPQKMYHFTNYQYAFEAAFSFNPEHPTSLLYEKHGDDYKLIGVMYTAPEAFWRRSTRPARSTKCRAVARAREFLRCSRGTKDGISHAASSIWFARINHYPGSL